MVNRGQTVAITLARATYAAVLAMSLEDRRSLLAYLLSLPFIHAENWMVAAMADSLVRMVRVAGTETGCAGIDKRTLRKSGYLRQGSARG